MRRRKTMDGCIFVRVGWGRGARIGREKCGVFLMAHDLSPSVEGVFGQDWHL